MTDANYWGINGKISRTVASNNLTVAIVDYDGNNFSSLNPLVYKIGDTPRTITGALSVTVNAGAASGTGTFNAGNTKFAAKEIDYFVYLGWRASDSSVFILVSRIPYATTYADFSSTASNEKYGAYSGTAPASTDAVVNIGRFNATNSGTGSYNWSVPATSIVINHPIFETRPLAYTPAWTSSGTQPAIGNGTLVGTYILVQRKVDLYMSWVAGSTTTFGTGTYAFSHPLSISQQLFDDALALDASAGVNYNGVTFWNGSNTSFVIISSATWGQTFPVTWANGDYMVAQYKYYI